MSENPHAEHKIVDAYEMLVGPMPPVTKHPGEFIRDVLLPEYGLNVAKLARLIGVNRPNLHNVLSGRVDVSRDLAYRLGALMNDHVADFLISYQIAWDKTQDAERRQAYKGTIERITPIDPDARKARAPRSAPAGAVESAEA